MTSAATLDAPNTLCKDWSMDISSVIPQVANLWDSSSSQRDSCSTSGKKFGVSPYTLLVDVKMNTASGQNCRVASSRCSVPQAFTSKSVSGSSAAQSCDGSAPAWITREMSRPNFLNKPKMAWRSRTSTG